jgi:hypothetical protein
MFCHRRGPVARLSILWTHRLLKSFWTRKIITMLALGHRLTSCSFQVHYGRWILLSPHATASTLLGRLQNSPLLLCSIYLIAVRHTTQELAGTLAPKLFQEVRALLGSALLVTPQTEEFFQAVIVLSIWSTTVGQVPLSIDGWLITSYALQQALASPAFADIYRQANRQLDTVKANRQHVWTHLCLAHLQ